MSHRGRFGLRSALSDPKLWDKSVGSFLDELRQTDRAHREFGFAKPVARNLPLRDTLGGDGGVCQRIDPANGHR